jgi:hypothetical protein
MLGMNFIN